MQTIENRHETSIEVKHSKFITHLVPISEFDGLQDKLKSEHPKASHVVYALRYLNEHDQIVENSSDDGEPKGSSGLPALNVMRGEELINCAVLIVRYFGGTKLGIGGLIRAYTVAVQSICAQANIIKYEKEYIFEYETTYSDVRQIEYILEQIEIVTIDKMFGIGSVAWRLTSTQEKIDEFKSRAGRSIKWSV